MKALTLRGNRPVRADELVVTTFLKQRGIGYEITSVADPDRLVFPLDHPSARPRRGSEVGGGVIITPPPVIPPAIFENGFAIPAGTTDYVISDRNFRNTDPLKALFDLPYNGRKVIFLRCQLESAGPIAKGWRNRVEFEDCKLTVLPQTRSGFPPARMLDLQEVKHVIFRNNTVPELGRGIYLTGLDNASGKKFWNGDYSAGDRIIIERNLAYNPLGQYSNGTGGVIQSNWGTTHSDAAVTGAGVRGWTPANFVQLNGMPECAYYIGYNFVFSTLGRSRAEDLISAFGGSGGISPSTPAIVEYNCLVTSGGYDWTFTPGESTVYNPSNQITTGATGFQNTAATRYSGTAQIIGDGVRTDLWEANANYTISRYNVALGPRPFITVQGGNSDTMIGNEIYWLDRHPDGTLYTGYTEALYQWTEGVANATAPKRATGIATTIWGSHVMQNNTIYQSGIGADSALSIGSTVTKNGDPAQSFGNMRRVGPTDGGAARIAAWKATQASEGRTIGIRAA